MQFLTFVLSIAFVATQTYARDTTLSLYSRYNNETGDPPRLCVFERIVVLNMNELLQIAHCETVRGTIEVTNFMDPVLRFDHLVKVEGSLIISNSKELTRIDAFSLRLVSEMFRMERLVGLGLVETPNLTTVKTLDLTTLPLLSQATLENLREVQSIVVSDTSLTVVSGFAAPKMRMLNINNNRFLERISFDAEEVAEELHVTGNARSLVVELGSLQRVYNMSVSNVRALNMTSLRQVDGSMSVVANWFPSVSFPSLTQIDGLFRLADNQRAASADLNSVLDVGGGVLITNNTELHEISFFSNLRSIGGALELVGNISQTEWASLKMVKGSISLRSSDPSFDCSRWTAGPIRNTLRGGEIDCKQQRKMLPTISSSSGALPLVMIEHLSESARKHYRRWILALLIVLGLSM